MPNVERGWCLTLDEGNATTKNACQHQNKYGEKSQNVSDIVTTTEYNRVYSIVYIFLIHICVNLDTLNINLEIIVYPQ